MNYDSQKLTIEKLLAKMNEWRFYPRFQLERHFDILLSFVLPELLAQIRMDDKRNMLDCLSDPPEALRASTIIPEFPLPLNLLYSNQKGFLTNAVDFAVFIPNADLTTINKVLFVELKTDEASARDAQTRYMHRIHTEGWLFSPWLESIINTILNSKQNARKYLFLLQKLSDIGLLRGLKDMFSEFQSKHRFLKAKYLSIDKISSHANAVECCSLVIAPGPTVDKIRHDKDLKQLPTLSFGEAKTMLEKTSSSDIKDDTFRTIAHYLGEWDQSPIKKIESFLLEYKE
jgi:hypothetical protein